jgi:hypothetical protein
MTDRELIERAARAAGYADLTEWSDKITDHDSPHYGMPALHPSGFGQQTASWNPLEDDADAFRLMVDCGLTVCTDGSGTVSAADLSAKDGVFITQPIGADKKSATRRAIVRAAAEMAE